MKILYTIANSTYGGATIHLLDLASGMKVKGHECIIVCPQGEMIAEYQKKRIKVIILEPKIDLDPNYIFRLFKILIREKIDILHTHLLKTTVNGLIAGYFAKVKVKIAHIHGTLYDWDIPNWRRKINLIINAGITNLVADRVIALTAIVKKDLIEHDKIRGNKIIIIYNGVNGNSFKKIQDDNYLYQKYHWDKKEVKIIGIIGRLTIERGHDCFIETAKLLRNKFRKDELRFVIVGDGELKESLLLKVKKERLDEVIKFTGFLSEEEKNKALKSFSVFVSPAVREGFGLSVVQAMLTGIPLVVSDLTVYQEVCPDQKCSLFAHKGDPDAFARQILTFLKNDHLRDKLVYNSLTYATEKFSFEKFVENYQNLYLSLLENKA